MTRLIMTTDGSVAGALRMAKMADIVFPFHVRFVWGPPLSNAKLAALATRSTQLPLGSHWLDFVRSRRLEEMEGKGLGLVELCERFETIQLWIGPEPNEQLTLIWLLDYLRAHAETASKLTLVQADVRMGAHSPEELANGGYRPSKS